MDQIWSPWRYHYVSQVPSTANEGTENPTAAHACFFCQAAQEPDADAQHLVVYRAEKCFAILNRYPYSTGHVMVAPHAHVATLEEAETATLEEMMRLAQQVEKALRATYRPEGINLGFNIGQCAGAGVAGHIHLHALPRWFGDTSFMTTVGETRVLPEDLPATFGKLRSALQNAFIKNRQPQP